MRYECRVASMMKLIVSWYNRFDVSNLLGLNSWQPEFGSHCLEFWVSYTRFLLSTEVPWNNNTTWPEPLLKLYAVVVNMWHSYDLENRYNRDLRIRNPLVWRITVTVIFASNFILLDSYQSAVKTWKSFSWMTQEKHDLMISLFAAFSIESLISYNSQLSIWWLTADWVTGRSNSSSFLSFYFFIFYTESMSCSRGMIRRERRRIFYSHWWNRRDRIRYVKLRKSRRFFTFTFHIHNTQRSVRSDSSLWRCFWHGSAFHAP